MITFLFFTRFPISAPCMFPPPSSCGAVGICPDPCEAGSAPPCSLSLALSPDLLHRFPTHVTVVQKTVDMPVTVQHVRHHGLVADRVDHYAVWFRITLRQTARTPHLWQAPSSNALPIDMVIHISPIILVRTRPSSDYICEFYGRLFLFSLSKGSEKRF